MQPLVGDTPVDRAGCQTLPQPSEMSKKKTESSDLPVEQAELCAEQAPNMKRPLFPDGFLINAHRSHPSARQEEPPASFSLCGSLCLLLLSLLPWGQVEGPLGMGGCQEMVLIGQLTLCREPSTCWGAGPYISEGEAPGEKPGLSPSFFLTGDVHTFSCLSQNSECFLCLLVSP